jgi:hypothetical protein
MKSVKMLNTGFTAKNTYIQQSVESSIQSSDKYSKFNKYNTNNLYDMIGGTKSNRTNRSNRSGTNEKTVIYSIDESEKVLEKIDDIVAEADAISSEKLKPTKHDLRKMYEIVRDFVIEKKRKIYGGFAISKLIESVNPEDKLYKDDDVKSWDIDFYSPNPISDAKEIANRLYAQGFLYIHAREAQHDETYKVWAETNDCADITYVPANIYGNIPFKIIDGYHITGHQFMMIDSFRVITDPMASYFRLDKTFTRLCKMLQYHAMPRNDSPLKIVDPTPPLDVAFRAVHDFLISTETTIAVGMYIYNHLVNESKINTDPEKSKYINFRNVNYYEIISTDYKNDARNLILLLKEKFSHSDKIKYVERYPWFQYLGYSVDIFYDGTINCKMYSNNSRCVPYNTVNAMYFNNKSYEKSNRTVKIGTFATGILFGLIGIMRAKTNKESMLMNIYYQLISHMTDMKNYYLKTNNKTIFDDGLFKEFSPKCIGITNTAAMERVIRIDEKMKKSKKFSWSYNPASEKDRQNDIKYVFKNSSGNPINNERNMKIVLEKTSLYENADADEDAYVEEEYVEDDADVDADAEVNTVEEDNPDIKETKSKSKSKSKSKMK